MTKEMKELIDCELATALESGDPKMIDRALINAQRAVADCQLKTSERVKIIADDHPVLVNDVKKIKELVTAAKKTFRRVAFDAIKWIAIGGGGAEFVRWLISNH